MMFGHHLSLIPDDDGIQHTAYYGKQSMAYDIATQWLERLAQTAREHNIEGHLDLLSRSVRLLGVPGFDVIDYEAWAAQCAHEFSHRIVKDIRYHGLKLAANNDSQIMFKTYEVVEASDGSTSAQGIEVLLEKETDGKWRVVQERVLTDEETAHAGLLPS